MVKVFLGGTCNNSTWREELINKLENVDHFNPVVDDWTEDCMFEELRQREICDYCLYVITPKMTGVYSIAEVVDDSNKKPEKTILCVIKDDGIYKFNGSQLRSLHAVGSMVTRNGGIYFNSINEVAKFLNNKGSK